MVGGRRPFEKKTFGGRRLSLEDDLCWKTTFSGKPTFSGRQPSLEDDLRWKMTFSWIQPLVQNDLWWKTTFSGRRPLVEDGLRLKTTFGGRWPSVEDVGSFAAFCSFRKCFDQNSFSLNFIDYKKCKTQIFTDQKYFWTQHFFFGYKVLDTRFWNCQAPTSTTTSSWKIALFSISPATHPHTQPPKVVLSFNFYLNFTPTSIPTTNSTSTPTSTSTKLELGTASASACCWSISN